MKHPSPYTRQMRTDLARPAYDNDASARQRIDWVDYAKGLCIVFVVMMHSTLDGGVAAGGEGWLHYLVAFAQPFRMPDFFLISGLPKDTWIRLIAWMAVGFVVYFLYAHKHAKYRAETALAK